MVANKEPFYFLVNPSGKFFTHIDGNGEPKFSNDKNIAYRTGKFYAKTKRDNLNERETTNVKLQPVK